MSVELIGLFYWIAWLIFFFDSDSQTEICEIAKSLRLNTAAGYDKIAMWFVKEAIIYNSDLLTYVLNLSF